VEKLIANLNVADSQPKASTRATATPDYIPPHLRNNTLNTPNSTSPFQNNRYIPQKSNGDGWSTVSSSSTAKASPSKRSNGWAKSVGSRNASLNAQARSLTPPPAAASPVKEERIKGLYNEDDEGKSKLFALNFRKSPC
jgi:hypothetical protein